MSKQTIKLVDTYCVAANWASMVETNKQTLAELSAGKPPPGWIEECEDEIKEWSAKRDKALAKLRAIVASLTDYEKDWVRRKCRGATLAQEFRALGVEPNWEQQS
jgi:hypothetical protein